MHVVNEGSVPTRKGYFKNGISVTCEQFDDHDRQGHCGAELMIKEKDLRLRYWKASHSNRYYFVVVCPRCKSACHVKLPDGIRQQLMTEAMRKKAEWDGFSDE